jgi:drug/metabolite transporter (DMT)-like permease
VALLIAAVCFGSLNGALMKLMSATTPLMMIVWGRYAAYLAVMLPIALYQHGAAVFRPPQVGWQIIRALVLLVSTLIFMVPMTRLPLADAVAIFYVYPFLMTAMSPLLLGERADALAWLGVAGGFLGVLTVMRPEFNAADFAALLALVCGGLTALFLLITRLLARTGDAVVMSTFTALACAAILTPALPLVWAPLTLWELGIFAALGIATSLSHWFTALAYGRAPAPFLAPFTYSEIAAAVVYGVLLFGDWPDAVAWLGFAIIVLSGILVARASWIPSLLRRKRR